jgi:gliding motility-associated-like protein
VKKLIIILVSAISCHYLHAQGEANIWYFGENAGLDFNSGTPLPLLDGQLNTIEGCASISDNLGNLLFYTDGITVWNKNHQVMLNGTGLNGDISSSNSAIIIPKPLSSNIFYIFTVDAVAGIEGLQYSEVDLSLDSGLGAVTTNKNILLASPVTEKITAIRRNGVQGYWVVAHDFNNNNFLSYSVTSAGVNATPVVSSVGSDISVDVHAQGCMKISPDRTKLAIANSALNVQLFDFDASSGVVSNPVTLNDQFNFEAYGVEFSPNSEVLYISSAIGQAGLKQYDLTAGSNADIIGSEIEIINNIGVIGQLQLATDGKIYVAKSNSTSIDVISNPNEIGLGCNYVTDAVQLNSGKSLLGLPPFIQSFFSISNIQFEFTCFGDDTEFSINDVVDSVIWDFGDPASGTNNSSTDFEPTHVFTQPGTYEVSVTATLGSEVSTDFISVTIYEQPIANPVADQVVCDDNGDGVEFYDLTQHANDILGTQDPSQFQLIYYDGIANYNNGLPVADETSLELLSGSIVNPVINIRNMGNPGCEDIVTFQIQILEGASPNQNVSPIITCDNLSFGTDTDGTVVTDLTLKEDEILNGQSALDFTVRYYTDALFSNEIVSPTTYQNTNPDETIYVLVENNNSVGNCIADTSFQLQVNALPTTAPVVTLLQCDDDLDGFSLFNLTEVYAELSANYQNETISFYENQVDAESGNNPISSETAYTNQTVSTDTVYTRVDNANGCYRISQVNLMVSTTQIPVTYTRDFYKCDDGLDTTDGIATFDFSGLDQEIQALFPTGQQLIINYYRNQADALSELNPISDISNYQNIGYPNGQDIFIRVDSALDNDCLGLGHHITLHVENVPTSNPVTIAEQCDADGDGQFEFDTSNIETALLNGQSNVTVTYTDELGNPLSSPLPNPFSTATQTITARVTNSTSQDPDGACFDEIQITFTVDAAVVANIVPDFQACDDDNDGTAEFDVTDLETQLLNGQNQVNIIYTDSDGNLLPNPLPNPFLTQNTIITARVESALSDTCYDETQIAFEVYEQPIANPVEDIFICDDLNDSQENFDLSQLLSEVSGNQNLSQFEVLFFESQEDADLNVNALPNNFQINSTTQPVVARIQNTSNNLCYDTSAFQIKLSYQPYADVPQDLTTCDDETNDEKELFNLTQQNEGILNGQLSEENTVNYYLTQADAENKVNPITSDFENITNPQTVFARVENVNNPLCYALTQFEVEVFGTPSLEQPESYTLCEGETIEIGIENNYDEYLWSTGDISSKILIDTPGTYELFVSSTYESISCESLLEFNVIQSNVAEFMEVRINDWQRQNNSFSVMVSGQGDYEYSIDGINYQDSNSFTNLDDFEYLLHIRDKNGCGEILKRVFLLDYPDFFTPNNDGFNDRWQIINASREVFSKILIFDRYGKLLADVSPTGSGWDGTRNGQPMPSDDYWFKVTREDGRVFTGHFTLKR